MSDETRITIGNEYEVIGMLGQGGMARVFRARHKYLDRVVALKMLPPRFLADDEARARFEREARAGAQLEHPHIVTTFDFGIYEDQPYLAVAFIEGETLTARIRRQGRLSPDVTAALIAPIAEALAYAHSKGVVHRDIKSSNIMIRREDERPMLIDFGIAHAAATQQLTQFGTMLGTPAYMSPEQAAARKTDYRSDLYSLGVVLYECLTGTVPFESSNTAVLLTNIKYEPHPSVHIHEPDVPAWLSALVNRCLAKQPEDRFESGEALAHALRAGPTLDASALLDQEAGDAFGHEPTVLMTSTPAGERRRHAMRWLAGALLALLVVVGGAYGFGALDGLIGSQTPKMARQDNPASPDQPANPADRAPKDTGGGSGAGARTDTDTTVPEPPLSTESTDDGTIATADSPTPSTATPPTSTAAADKDIPTATSPSGTELLARARLAYEADNFSDALPLLEEAAQQGANRARLYLARMYENGLGVRKNATEAAQWYHSAAAQGLAEAQLGLSTLYRDGRGVEKSLEAAAQWCRRAAEQGLAEAQFDLARMYFRGHGVPQSDEEAAVWYRKAAAQGHTRAQGALRRLTGEN